MQTLNHVIVLLLISVIMSCNTSDDTVILTNTNTTEIQLTTTVTTLGGSLNDSAQSVVATTDGGYAILGYTQSNDGDIVGKTNTSFDFWLLKYSAQHTLEWQNTYGGSLNDRGFQLIQTVDGGFAIIGFTSSSDGDVSQNAGVDDFWLLKTDALGQLQWQNTYGYSGIDRGTTLLQTTDNGFLITGVLDVTASNGEGETNRNSQRHAGGDYWCLKLSENGAIQWSRYYGGNFTDTPLGIVETNDGNYIVAGSSDSNDTDISNNKGTYDFWSIKIDTTGQLLWEKSYGGSQIDEARAIVKTTDGNFIIAGDTRSSSNDVSENNGAADIWLIKIDTNGNLIWERAIGGNDFDVARDIKAAQNNAYIVSGSSRSATGDITTNNGQNDALIAKVNTDGNLVWETTVGGSNIDFSYGVTQLNNGTFVAVGDTTSSNGDITQPNKGFTDALIVIINEATNANN